ncbi:hypothetical protein [Streptomyces rubellomurinus]|uniref:hypothetical protein n=1 Tax=Streptomyces rubellomurinus (strain ATCC 31215) TaxID=359131 RepID=UPI0012FF46C2|nr:hypothetical protein [Streptomyces rubellomurinus]
MLWRLKDGSNRLSTSLQARCEERVRALEIPAAEKLTIPQLCRHIGRLQNRSILLVPLELPVGSPDGLWISADDLDYVVFEQRLAPVHQHQVILHEIGHLVCGHEAAPVMTPDSSRLLLPSLDPEMVRRVLGRQHEHSEVEVEAELVGSLIGRQIGTWTVRQTWNVPPEAQGLSSRLAALESPNHRGIHE